MVVTRGATDGTQLQHSFIPLKRESLTQVQELQVPPRDPGLHVPGERQGWALAVKQSSDAVLSQHESGS